MREENDTPASKLLRSKKGVSTYRQRIDEGLLHVVAELVADHAPEHAHVLERQVVDVQVTGWHDLESSNKMDRLIPETKEKLVG